MLYLNVNNIFFFSHLPSVGTNGAVSLIGLVSSALGGFIVGCGFYLSLLLTYDVSTLQAIPPQWPVILFATVGGFLGSLIDSLLGATLQYSGESIIKLAMYSNRTNIYGRNKEQGSY